MISKNTVHKMVAYVILAAVCVITIVATSPIISRYIDDPNLISYFNHDESFLMGIIWYYYSGQKGPYYRFESDYGVEMLYLADFARYFLSKFIKLTPGIFIFIMRWLHLIFWILSLLALWRLVVRHFKSMLKASAAVALLAVNSGFPLAVESSKPDPVTLFFIIIGLDYALRIFDNKQKLNIVVAVACAALATIIKFSGIFLVPAVVIAIYLSARRAGDDKRLLPEIRYAWALPGLIGSLFILLPFISIFFYARQGSGMTLYEEYGLPGSILHNGPISFIMMIGVIFIASSLLLYFTDRKGGQLFGVRINVFNELLSYSVFVVALFMLFLSLFGFKWLIDPSHFIKTYSVMIPVFLAGVRGVSSAGGTFLSLCPNFISKIKELDPFIIILFLLYLFIELKNRKISMRIDRIKFFKRITLASFAVLLFPCIFFLPHIRSIHTMPFFAVCTILSLQIVMLFHPSAEGWMWLKRTITSIVFICFMASALHNSRTSFKIFKKIYEWRKDDVFKIAQWWKRTYPVSTSIVADNPLFVYIPPEYKNVHFLSCQGRGAAQLKSLVEKNRPRLVYYNTLNMPPIENIFTDTKVRLIADFNSPSSLCSDQEDAKYVIYEVIY